MSSEGIQKQLYDEEEVVLTRWTTLPFLPPLSSLPHRFTPQPKNPRCAESGDGCTEVRRWCFFLLILAHFFCALPPQRINTTPFASRSTAAIKASVNLSQPILAWEFAWREVRYSSTPIPNPLPWTYISLLYSQWCIQQEDALSSPWIKMTMRGNFKSFGVLELQFLVNIFQGRWRRNAMLDREAEPMSLIRAVIRIFEIAVKEWVWSGAWIMIPLRCKHHFKYFVFSKNYLGRE